MKRSLLRMVGLGTVTLALAGACSDSSSTPPFFSSAGPVPPTPVARRDYTEPVALHSREGVLEVVLTVRQGEGQIDTAAGPVKNMLLFSYQILKGSASNGQSSGTNLYPGPTLQVNPGDRLVVHAENRLSGLTIRDFFNPAFTPAGQPVPLEPPQLTDPPFNLHTHGLHVSPQGNSDNVLLTLPANTKNVYSYQIPANHPEGLYWYHSHLHTLTAVQTYAGMAGMLVIGRADGGLPAVTQAELPVRTMALQYNSVFARKDGLRQLNNLNWCQYVSTLQDPAPGQLAAGTYRPLLAPVNFLESQPGTRFVTNWYSGNLSVNNNRGQFQFIPSNLLDFQSNNRLETPNLPANPGLPDAQRDTQFTVNGVFQPRLRSRPGQTEIWVLANISDFAYMNVRLTETATGRHPQLTVVGQDGNPYPRAHTEGTSLVIAPASRYAIAVTIPPTGDLVLEMPPGTNLPGPFTGPGIAYTNDGTSNPPATLGTVSVDTRHVSYFDGFFITPTQELLRATGDGGGTGTTVTFANDQELGANSSFVDTQGREPAVRRRLEISGGFNDQNASQEDPKAFVYEFNGQIFPYTPLLRARLNTIEQWNFVNFNNDQHPIHIHVNDFQVTELIDPVAQTIARFLPWGQDNQNVPFPSMDASGNVLAPGLMSLRTLFQDFLGTYVVHCHRLNHEDSGLMAVIDVIPTLSTYAVARPDPAGTRVDVFNGDQRLASLVPFAGHSGPLSLAMADIDGDAVLDLIAGSSARVAIFSGAGGFTRELARLTPFGEDFTGGVSVAAAWIDGQPTQANLIVGSGPGREATVRVYGNNFEPISEFKPYPGSLNGVTVAVGKIELGSGRESIVTVPGPGQAATIRAFRYDLLEHLSGSASASCHCGTECGCTPVCRCGAPGEGCSCRDCDCGDCFCGPSTVGKLSGAPTKVAEFTAFDSSYTGGVALAVDWTAGGQGGAQMIAVSQLQAPGEVRVYSSGSALDGSPPMYTMSPAHHDAPLSFRSVLNFQPLGATGVRVATSSTTSGADLLVGGAGKVSRFELSRPDPQATQLAPSELGSQNVEGGVRGLGGD